MRLSNIGEFRDVNSYVQYKIDKFNNSDRTFQVMFQLMFSEQDNILFEESHGYRINKKTYGEVKQEILCLAKAIEDKFDSSKKGTTVGLYMDNSVEWIEVMWAILIAGYKPLLMNTRLDEASLNYALQVTEASYIIHDDVNVLSNTSNVVNIHFQELEKSTSEVCENDVWGEEVLVMSSGTSNTVKICAYGAEEFHYQINDSAKIIRECTQIKSHYEGELKLLTFLPFYHVFELIAVYIWFTFFSRTLVLLKDFKPNTILDTVRRHKVTHIFAVPLLWERVYEQAMKTIKSRGVETYNKFLNGMRISKKIGDISGVGSLFKKKAFQEVRDNIFGDSIQFLIAGGSKIDSEVLEFFNSIGYHIANGYGMTEIGITSVELSSKASVRNKANVGKPFGSITYRISDEGELLVSGSSMAKYVIKDGNKISRPEWFNTRDLAECVDGDYRILGRSDDVIVASNGENLNPNIIEPHFTYEGIKQVCLTYEYKNDVIIPVLIVGVDSYITHEVAIALDKQVRNQLEKLGLGTSISKVVYTTTPLMGEDDFKLNRTNIANRLQQGELEILVPDKIKAASDSLNDRLMDKIRELMGEAINKPAQDIDYDADFFFDLEGTSLDYFSLVSAMEDTFAIKINPSEDNVLKSAMDFYIYIEGNRD